MNQESGYVCVCEREKERERESAPKMSMHLRKCLDEYTCSLFNFALNFYTLNILILNEWSDQTAHPP